MKRSRKKSVTKYKKRRVGFFFSTILPLSLVSLILFGLGFLLMVIYRSFTHSEFFSLKRIEIEGINRIPRDEIERVIRAETIGVGVWNADISLIKHQLEKNSMVKEAIVTRQLPDTLRVKITERVPFVIVQGTQGYFWIDDEAKVIKKATENEIRENIILSGWEEEGSQKNERRIELAKLMLSDFSKLGVKEKVKAIDLSSLQEPKVLVEDSGVLIPIFLGNENFGQLLRKALEVLEGRGKEIESVFSQGGHPIVRFRRI
ncbi:MAG: FtsQ-type POTRA domain-containing protein [Pyrinomonadaceae bacterium]|nr:FtsQ-type POTRA domain-containing protein [Pyrinomonadaceae bacterium]MCX7639780.1 FtsQ-type POTRA domain-containing protein [Pyrinomonadaceae bacterium]MDW8304363.1 FtsQ-type POTRA domain-containing protein [Acidobacteriota bacterium]